MSKQLRDEKGEGLGPPLCLACKRPLIIQRKGARYCDANCRRQYNRFIDRGGTASNPLGNRACVVCGNALKPTARKGTRYCSQACRSKGKTRTRPFVALDGEGEGENPNHVYTLLASSTGKYIEKRSGLSTEECLDFLLALPRGSNSGAKPIYTWFAFDYDVNMILADVPLKGKNSVEQLKQTNRIWWRGYSITYIRRKILRISYGTRRHTSYDVWGFFQGSFEKALTEWKLEIPSIITEGKASRSDFSKWTLRRIREYNNAELELLAQLCERLRDAVAPLNLPIQSWHGPAALAASWLRKNGVKSWMGNPDDIPADFQDVCTRAYFGGRIDVLGYGIIHPVYHYDIVSAYPSATTLLPNLSKLTWERHRKGVPKAGGLYVARIKWEIPAAYWAPFPWRSNNGTIRYPLEGEGWYWFPEVESAQRKYGKKNIRVMEWWEAQGEIEYPFHDLIHSTFLYRKQLKKEGHASHIAVKLVLNSLYGKFAQTVGNAQYYSTIWAGLVTSHTRAKLMDVITDDVVCVMTDSIWSMKPLDIPTGGGLGDWEEQEETRLVLAEAGLYQATNPSGDTSTWQRGFDKRNPVDIEELVSKWIADDPLFTPTYAVLRFIGMGLATVTKYPWRQWVSINRKIQPVPLAGTTKRLPHFPLQDPKDQGQQIFYPLYLRPRDNMEISAPYAKLTQDPEMIEQRLEDECEEEL